MFKVTTWTHLLSASRLQASNFLDARTESLTKTKSRSQTGATSTANLLLAFQPQFTHKTAVKTSKNDLHNYSIKLVVDDWVSLFLAKVLPAASATPFFLLSLHFLLPSILSPTISLRQEVAKETGADNSQLGI